MRAARFASAAIHRPVVVPGSANGPLAGLRFAVKDVIDVIGCPTTAGNPEWASSHPLPDRSAPVVDSLLAAGATLIGKALTDELAFSINGTNPHYGTPHNPAAPGHLPGGSSSGPAAAVAAGECDFAIGTDTGGSIRIPASYCAVFGLRPTYGRVDTAGVVPLARSFDTVGWLARDADVMSRVAEVLLEGPDTPLAGRATFVPLVEGFAVADAEVSDELLRALGERFGQRVKQPRALGADLYEWARVRRVIQSHETWRAHGAWVSRHLDSLGSGVRARMLGCAEVTSAEHEQACRDRARLCDVLDSFLQPGEILCFPSAPAPPPPLTASPDDLQHQRERAFALAAPAGLWGSPQLTTPAVRVHGLPIGLGFMGRPAQDRAVLDSWRLASTGEPAGAGAGRPV